MSTSTAAPIAGRTSAMPMLGLMAAAGVFAWLAGDRAAVLASGLVYAAAFLALAWARPEVALTLVFASAPFQQDLGGGLPVKFSIAEINLLLSLVALLVRCASERRALSIGPIGVPVAFYIAVCLLSSALTWRGGDAVTSIVQILVYLLAAVVAFSSSVDAVDDLLLPLVGLVCVGVGLAVVGAISGSNYYLGLHKNGIGASLSASAVVCLELWFAARSGKHKQLLVVALGVITVGLLLTLSRGSWFAALGGACVIVVLRRQFGLLMKAAAVLVPLVAIGWSYLPAESREFATGFERERYNINARYDSFDYALAEFQKSPVIGVGVGLRKQYDATNTFALTLAETGVLGLLAFLSIHVVFFAQLWRTQRHLDRSDPVFSLLAVGGALVLGRLIHGMVDHYWSRGALMLAWASAGMATAAWLYVRQGPAHSPYEEGPE